MGVSTANAMSMESSTLPLDTVQALIPFNSLMPDHLQDLLRACSQQLLFAGDQLFQPGQYDSDHVYLLHGELRCDYPDGRTEIIKSRSSRTPVAAAQPRQCAVTATQDCQVLRVDRQRLDKLLAWSQVAEYLLVDIAYDRNFDEDLAWMNTVLKSNLFLKVPPTNVHHIFSKLTAKAVLKGDVIIRQGELGDCCYFIKEGTAEVTRSYDEGRDHIHLADISVGRCFGEDALLQETVRNASITMTSDGVLMQLDKTDFLQLLKEPLVNQVTSVDVFAAIKSVQADVSTKGVDHPAMVLIDVRSEDEYALGHLDGAINVPLNILRLKSRVLASEQGIRFAVYCNSGRRSSAAAYLLHHLGFDVQVLKSGFEALTLPDGVWSQQDYVLKQGVLLQGR